MSNPLARDRCLAAPASLTRPAHSLATTNQNCYEHPSGLTAEPCFSVYGFEVRLSASFFTKGLSTDQSPTRARGLQYQPGADGYIQWINDGISAWTLKGAGMGANAEAEVGNRPVPYEPMVRRAFFCLAPFPARC